MEGASLLKVAFCCFLVVFNSFCFGAPFVVGSGLLRQTQANNIRRSFMLVGFVVMNETAIVFKCYTFICCQMVSANKKAAFMIAVSLFNCLFFDYKFLHVSVILIA